MTGTRGPALAGVTVVDLTQFEAGPVCTQLLAWLGATVIKVERPGSGEQGRRASSDGADVDSYYFIVVNCNKKSVTADLKNESGLEMIRRLLRHADVFVENFAPGTVERLGLAYDMVRELNPRLVYARIKGFGADSPYERFPAFDHVGQAMGGAASLTGEPEGPPLLCGLHVADSGAGVHCALAIVAALYQRTVTGRGQLVEVALQDTVMSMCRPAWGWQNMAGEPPLRAGNNGAGMWRVAPSGAYPCSPGGPNDYVFIYTSRWPGSDQWKRLLGVLDRLDLVDDPRFATPESRYAHREELDALIGAWTSQRSKVQAMEELGRAGVPAGAVLTTAELSGDRYLRERGMIVTLGHPTRGPVVMPGCPIRMSDSQVPIVPAPLLGQHNEEIYGGLLGVPHEALEDLRRDGAI